jgi:rare lipoprotein A
MKALPALILAAAMAMSSTMLAAPHHRVTKHSRHLTAAIGKQFRGLASWYAQGHGTASGRKFNPKEFTAASRTLPFGTKLLVQNLRNGKSTVVEITDRGPQLRTRILDLALAPAKAIGCSGVCMVTATVQ